MSTTEDLVPAPAVVRVPVVGGGAFPVRRVYCVGRNYAAHAREMGHSDREPPFFFAKPADALFVVPEGRVAEWPYPSATADLHHEIELVVALKSGGRDIDPADAMQHVFGYAVGLDMTRRDLQAEAKKMGRPWDSAKGFDAGGPISPIRPAAQCPDAGAMEVCLAVNGTVRQRAGTDDLIWSIAETIAACSRLWELKAGDLIFSGTPEGVNAVQRGDRLVGEVPGVGRLELVVA